MNFFFLLFVKFCIQKKTYNKIINNNKILNSIKKERKTKNAFVVMEKIYIEKFFSIKSCK